MNSLASGGVRGHRIIDVIEPGRDGRRAEHLILVPQARASAVVPAVARSQPGRPAAVPSCRLVTPGYRARAPIGSQAGSTIGSASRALCRPAGSALLRAAISKTYWPNQGSFIV